MNRAAIWIHRVKTAAASRVVPVAGAVSLFAFMTWWTLRPLFGADLSRLAPLGAKSGGVWLSLGIWDQRYAIWAATRNARAMLPPTVSFFDSGQCFPAPHSLALGHGAIALGLWALPARLISRDPVTVYNLTLVLLFALSPLAVWLLVKDWTGDWVAGAVAGAFFGFNVVKIGAPEHVFLTDTAWFVLWLHFMRRFLGGGARWSHAIGFALCGVGQLAAGVYPAVGAAFAGAVVLGGLVLDHRPGAIAARRLAIAIAVMGCGAAALMWHYFGYLRAGVMVTRGRIFMSIASLGPGGEFFPGVVALLLAGAGVFSRRTNEGRDVRARLSLVLAVALVTFLATGGFAGMKGQENAFGAITKPTKVYEFVAGWVPGLNAGRGPAYAYGAAHVCFSVLIGLGFHSLLGAASRNISRPAVVLGLRAVAAAFVVAACLVGRPRFQLVAQRPADHEIAMFRQLKKEGSRGPVLELPVVVGGLGEAERSSASLLLAAYHRRPTSACFASFVTTSLPGELRDAIAKLPDASALPALEKAGFTTIWVHRTGTNDALVEGLTKLTEASLLRTAFAGDKDAVFELGGGARARRE